MGTHPIFESDFDCLTDFRKSMSRAVGVSRVLSRRFLTYETTKTHKDHSATRKFLLNKLFGQGKLSEKQYFANEYKRSCMWSTGLWLLWSMWIFNDKWDSVSFLVKSNKTPQMYPAVPVKELHWTPFGWGFWG